MAVTESGHWDGTGATLEDAIKDAHRKMTAQSTIADEHFKSRVTAFGFESGTIAGIRRFWATVTKLHVN